MRNFACIFASLLLFAAFHANAASCSAKNDVGDSCSIDCDTGQQALCQNATGSSTPTCECKDSSFARTFKSGTQSRGAALLPLAVAPAPIQNTNAADLLNAKLALQRDVKLRQECHTVDTGKQECHTHFMPCVLSTNIDMLNRCPVSECFPITAQQCSIATGKVQVAGAIMLENDPTVTVQEPNWNGIPTSFLGRKLTYLNCSPKDQQQTFTVTQEATTGGRVQMTKTIQSTSGITAKVGFSYFVDVDVTASFSQTVSTSTQDEQNFQQKQTITESDPVVIPANSYTEFEVLWRRVEVPIKFSGVALVDAPITPNLEQLKLASQILPSAADRSVPFEGYVYNATVLGAQISNKSRATTAAECQNVGPKVKLVGIDAIAK